MELVDIDINENSLKEKIEGKESFVLIIGASWNKQSEMLIENVLSGLESLDQINKSIYFIDMDIGIDTVSGLGVNAIPTLILFKEGVDIYRFVGLKKSNEIYMNISSRI